VCQQKNGEDVMAYSTHIEQLHNLILEQERSGKSVEVSKALEASLKVQTVQVFIEGLGALKNFIKVRHPPTLEKAIQSAREEESDDLTLNQKNFTLEPQRQAISRKSS